MSTGRPWAGAVCVAVFVVGCGDDDCVRAEPSARDSGPLDASVDSGRLDAGDGIDPPDAGSRCGEIRPGEVYLSPVVRAVGPRLTEPCSTHPLSGIRVRVFSESGAIVLDATMDCSGMGVAVGVLPPGEYALAVDHEQWSTGASLTRPGACPSDATNGPHCVPVRFVVDPCDLHIVPVALHCDRELGECASLDWPWS